jgi:hypothetical protein
LLLARKRSCSGVFDTLLKHNGFKKLPINVSSPQFFTEEIGLYQSSHLVIGVETRSDKNMLTSCWSASAVEINDQSDDLCHLEFCIRPHTTSLHGKNILVMLVEFGRYLECTRSNIILPPLKTSEQGEKYEHILSLIGIKY